MEAAGRTPEGRTAGDVIRAISRHFRDVKPTRTDDSSTTITGREWALIEDEIVRLREIEGAGELLRAAPEPREKLFTQAEVDFIVGNALNSYKSQRLEPGGNDALRGIVSAYERRSELFTNDADCAVNLADRARLAITNGDSHHE